MTISQDWGVPHFVELIKPFMLGLLNGPQVIEETYTLFFTPSVCRNYILWELRLNGGEALAGGSIKGVKYAYEVTCHFSGGIDSEICDDMESAYSASLRYMEDVYYPHARSSIKLVVVLSFYK
jgi:hypothetical protein